MRNRERDTARAQRPALAVALVLTIICAVSVAVAQEVPMAMQTVDDGTTIVRFATAQALNTWADPEDGTFVETLGFHAPGDGGEARYRVGQLPEGLEPNGADVIALENGLVAVLMERNAVNYRMFGAIGDGENDDGVQIKLAHEYANRNNVPVINLNGEFWIKQTNEIVIQTNARWGNTVFHIDERYNVQRTPRFVVSNDEPTETLELDDELKATLLERIKPGVQIIPELAEYSNHLITVVDSEDRIGIRAGYENHRGWAREDFFYVEEEGRIIGDIAWEFNDFTSVTAAPCGDSYLIIEGGGFRVSGHNPETGSTGYHWNGFSIRRSRTIIREQWVGLEEGARDESLAARSGFYSFSRVYDCRLEDIRLMPWEKSRREPEVAVPHGTYGIGGSRMLNCTFRNLTAEAGWISWGVFGTNLNKNFRIEKSRLNRIDVHFHCWNLYIEDCQIGFKGISITGGGDLFVENTTRDGNTFISFRPDYGSKWDGRIRLRGCTLRPTGTGATSVLNYRMRNFDYQYPIGFARSVAIEDFVVDYAAAPTSEAPVWLMNTVGFSRTDAGNRLFFPSFIKFADVRVEGREQGVRLIRIPNPEHYDVRRAGGYDGARLTPTCTIDVENVQLERLTPERPGDTGNVHLLIGSGEMEEYTDERSLYPQVRFADCNDVSAYFGENAIASARFDRSSINTVTAPNLRGELSFSDCRFHPDLQELAEEEDIYALESTLGTRFTNCTVHAPVVGGEAMPDLVDRTGFVALNGPVRHYHLNTGLGSHVLDYARDEGIELEAEFIQRLKLNHALEQ